jgi:uncharacterized OsmC-like protein
MAHGSRADDVRIERALERLETALDRRPGFGRDTRSCTTTLLDGTRCRSEEGSVTVLTDLPPGLGGRGSAPAPGTLLRAALGSCLTMGYRLRATRQGVELRSVRVVVETDAQVEGMLRPRSTVRPGFTDIRYRVEIEPGAGFEVAAVEAMIGEADRLSPMLDVVGRTNALDRTISVGGGAR